MHKDGPIWGAERLDLLRERAKAARAGVAVGPAVPRQKHGDQHDALSPWLTLAQYARQHDDVSVAALEAGIESGLLYAPTFYGGQPRVRYELVQLWRLPVREGTYAAGAGRWPIDVQLRCDKFFHYLSAAVIVYPESPEQRERLSAEYDRIVKAFEHVIRRTLTVQEAERAITIFLACFNEHLPEGPDDHVRYPSEAAYFAQRRKPTPRTPHPYHGRPTYGLSREYVTREAWRRVQAPQSSQVRFAIAKRALRVYHATNPWYTGHPEDRQTITRVLASISAEPCPEAHQQGRRTSMAPEYYVVWCLTRSWDPFSGQRLARELPRPEQYAYLPSLFSPLRHTPDDQKMNHNWARRHSNLAWLEEAVDSLHDLQFWGFSNQEEADMIGQKMRLMWLDENNPHGRFSLRF